jgi:hypothetical protein
MKMALIIAAVIAAIVATAALYVGFQHNAQMEFFDTPAGKIDYAHSLMTFGVGSLSSSCLLLELQSWDRSSFDSLAKVDRIRTR